MSMLIEKLLRLQEYDIYNNTNMDRNKLCELAECFSEEGVDLSEYFYLTKFASKFCWANPIYIISKMKYPYKLKGLPWLFMLLQDVNWPIFNQAVEVLQSFEKKDILPCIEEYLCQAYSEDDGMWISGIQVLVEAMNIEQSEFRDKEIFKLFKYGDLCCDE